MLKIARAAALLCCSPAMASTTTWVVDDDGGPGVDFVEIQAAIDAAAPGDIVLVHPGLYTRFTLDKGLTVTALTPGTPVVQYRSDLFPIEFPPAVIGIPAGETAVLSGLTFVSPYLVPAFVHRQEALTIAGSQGTVRLVDVTARAIRNSDDAVRVTDSPNVFLVRCKLSGADAWVQPFGPPQVVSFAGSGLRAFASGIAFEDCALVGGLGAGATGGRYPSAATRGGIGLELNGGTTTLLRTIVLGRRGGNGAERFEPHTCLPPNDGGSGAVVAGGAALLHANSLFLGGAPGRPADGHLGCHESALPGQPIQIVDGSVTPPHDRRTSTPPRAARARSPAPPRGGASTAQARH